MLELLRIKNLALIDDLELEFSGGLNALTGETGAGKSFIVGAVNFLTGEKMGADMVRAGRDRAVVEGLFAGDGEDGGDLVIRRELSADTGRSRIFVNDSLASQEALRDLKGKLVLHASQHGQQRLLQPAFQARLLDAFMDRPDLFAAKAAALKELAAAKQELAALRERGRSLEERRQLLEYQRDEIAKVKPRRGEEDELVSLKARLATQSKAKESIESALSLILGENGAAAMIGALTRETAAVAELFPDYAADVETLDSARIHLKDLASRLRGQSLGAFDDGFEDGQDEERGAAMAAMNDPEKIEARLWELSQLKRKLKRGLDEIVELSAEIDENLSFLDACGLDAQRLEKRERELAGALKKTLASLDAARREAAEKLGKRLEAELAGLGFAKELRVLFEFSPADVYASFDGTTTLTEDRARLLWAPNPGQPPQPLDKIASGGELSRFLLAVIGLLSEENQPTLIFDEVDAGIGGMTLTRVGERIKALGTGHQIILITHWPQLAALADRHFQVRKEIREGATHTLCNLLDKKAVREELSRMAGGGGQGEAMVQGILGAD